MRDYNLKMYLLPCFPIFPILTVFLSVASINVCCRKLSEQLQHSHLKSRLGSLTTSIISP